MISALPLGLQIRPNNGIYIPYNKNGKASGEAFVHFETIEDCNQALQRNMNKLGHRFVTAIFFLKTGENNASLFAVRLLIVRHKMFKR